MHLWEVKHSYYCAEQNFYSTEEPIQYKSWACFEDDFGDSDMDYNLLFRWDWKEENPPPSGDENYRNGQLHIFLDGTKKRAVLVFNRRSLQG